MRRHQMSSRKKTRSLTTKESYKNDLNERTIDGKNVLEELCECGAYLYMYSISIILSHFPDASGYICFVVFFLVCETIKLH